MPKHKMFILDARGLDCPQPVLETKKVFEVGTHSHFQVIVDNPVARENVCRFARNQGAQVDVSQVNGADYFIDIDITNSGVVREDMEELIPCTIPNPGNSQNRTVVYIGSEIMGRGDDNLGLKLMRGFLRTMIDVTPQPWRMIFINSGVKLTTVDQEAVEAISLLLERGVEILSCGTCLEAFGVADQLRAGRVTNMYEVIESMNSATKVISPD